jgi:signal transduction histidine kinase
VLQRNEITELDRYQRLIELSRDLASTLNLDALLNRIVHAATDLTDAAAASIMLYDDINQELYFHSATNISKPLMRGLIVPVEGSIAGWIFTNREPLIVSDVHKDPRYYGHVEKTTQFLTHSILGVPLITKEKVVGVLEAINHKDGQFTAANQEMLMTLGAQAAVAIENARLFQQSDLVAEFVHELRTPLASINAAAHLLMRPEISEEQRNQMSDIINNETLRLSEMATSFLDYARLESGRTTFTINDMKLDELLDECSRVMKVRLAEKNLTLEIHISEDLPEIEGDRDKLKQVFINLLSNAHKYNRPNGSITLTAEVKGDEVLVSVEDTGIGISENDIPNLFEKFYRVPGSDKISTGSGLGLSISKRIVEAHGGRINVRSKLGQGTTFTVHLPL